MAANLKEASDRVRDASKTNRTRYSRPNAKAAKLKSKGLLAHRTTGQPPFCAWVESEKTKVKEYPQNAEYSALDEERRLQDMQNGKQEKLKRFQQDVRKRVKALERLKQLKLLDKSCEAVTAEQNIIYQSSFPKKISTTKKDTCVYHEAKYSSLQVGIPGSCKYGYSVVNDPEEVNVASQLLDKQVKKVQICTNHARKALGSQILNIDVEQLTQLPGGIWNGAMTATQGDENYYNLRTTGDKNLNIPIISENIIPDQADEIKDMSMYDDDKSPYTAVSRPTMDNVRRLTGAVLTDDNNDDGEKYRQENERITLGEITDHIKNLDLKTVSKNKVTEDLIRPGKVKEQSKKQVQKQLAVYRRLFMDIEREQVRENLRMKEHRKKMTRLKNKQEIRRKEVENEIDEIIEERDLITKQKTFLEEKLVKEHVQEEIIKREKKIQKGKELERYIDALRATVQEKISKRRIEVPSLCSCGPTIFDTNPDTCANNCVFYKNPKGYIKALSSVLSSMDLDL